MGAGLLPPGFGWRGAGGGGAARELEEPAEGEPGFGPGDGKGNGGQIIAGVGAGGRDLEDFAVAEEAVDFGGEAPAAIRGEPGLAEGLAPAGGAGAGGEGVHHRVSPGSGRRGVRRREC